MSYCCFIEKRNLSFLKRGLGSPAFLSTAAISGGPTSFYLRRVHVAQSVCYSQVRGTPEFAVHEGCPPNEQQLHRNVRTLSETLDWLAGLDRVSVAELRSYLLPLDLLPAALLDELNERALDLTGDLAVEAVGDEILVTKAILARVVGHNNPKNLSYPIPSA
ncbi:MAG: hypothetical protein PHV02_19970 [Rhodocyclaceae bacterium]|nr:hypothetical protein [Rhodocyclaceae bacterium]